MAEYAYSDDIDDYYEESGGWSCGCGTYNEDFRCHCADCGDPGPAGCSCGLDDEGFEDEDRDDDFFGEDFP